MVRGDRNGPLDVESEAVHDEEQGERKNPDVNRWFDLNNPGAERFAMRPEFDLTRYKRILEVEAGLAAWANGVGLAKQIPEQFGTDFHINYGSIWQAMRSSAELLCQQQPGCASQVVGRLAQSQNEVVRYTAASLVAFAAADDPEVNRDLILALLHDDSELVRRQASTSLVDACIWPDGTDDEPEELSRRLPLLDQAYVESYPIDPSTRAERHIAPLFHD